MLLHDFAPIFAVDLTALYHLLARNLDIVVSSEDDDRSMACDVYELKLMLAYKRVGRLKRVGNSKPEAIAPTHLVVPAPSPLEFPRDVDNLPDVSARPIPYETIA